MPVVYDVQLSAAVRKKVFKLKLLAARCAESSIARKLSCFNRMPSSRRSTGNTPAFQSRKRFGKAFIFCCICFVLISPTISYGGIVRPTHFEWSYDTTVLDLAGYVLYRNGQAILEIRNPAASSIDYDVMFESGANIFTMSAFDLNGNSSNFSEPFVIEIPSEDASGNILPVARIQASVEAGDAPLAVDFDAGGSIDYDGQILEYSWDFGDGSGAVGDPSWHVFETAGVHTVTLTVRDDGGATAVDSATITVNNPATGYNEPPVISVKTSVSMGLAPLLVSFDASASADPDGYIAQYAWNFGDGNEDFGPTVDHIFQNAGVYSVTASITDNDGAVTQKGIAVTVTDSDMPQAIAISFQPARSLTPAGFAPDSGQLYDEARGYGWTVRPLRNGLAKERNSDLSPDKAYDTLIQAETIDIWEIALPNGTYSVTVCMGDATLPKGRQSVQAETIPIITDEMVSKDLRWIVREQIVEVRDGRLSLTFNGSESEMSLNWVKVVGMAAY